jgi:hypothetical protein
MIWPMKIFRSEIQLRDTPDIIRQGWCDLMEDYMSRRLTKGCDKLLALSGLARSDHKKFEGSDYVAGIWTKHLPHALLWRMADDRDAQRSTVYRAPSFSFLSLDGPMRYEGQMRRPPIGHQWEDKPGEFLPKNLYIISASIKPIGLDLFGAISQASLAVRGRLMQVRLKHRDEEEDDAACRGNVLDKFDGSLLGVFFPDVAGELRADKRAWCMAVSPEPQPTYAQMPSCLSRSFIPDTALIMGLALQRDDESENIFRRVGLIRWMRRSAFNRLGWTDFTLV